MEADMLAISKGEKTREEVVRSSKQMYKELFLKVQEQCAKMDEVLLLSLSLCFLVAASIHHIPQRCWPNIFLHWAQIGNLHLRNQMCLHVEDATR
jgi:hypothetical protein